MHVLIKAGSDEHTALREKFLKVRDCHSVGIDVANLELPLLKGTLRGDGWSSLFLRLLPRALGLRLCSRLIHLLVILHLLAQ